MEQPTVWRIKDWDLAFEDRHSREISELKYLRVYTLERRSEAFSVLFSSKSGIFAYGMFWAIVQIAARLPTRGVLEDERGPLTVERIAARLHTQKKHVLQAFAILTSPEVGWLIPNVRADCAPTMRRSRADDAPITRRSRAENGCTSVSVSETASASVSEGAARDDDADSPRQGDAKATAEEAERLDKRARTIARKPDWLPEGKGWINPRKARELAALPITQPIWDAAMLEAKNSRASARNPAGVAIAAIEKALRA